MTDHEEFASLETERPKASARRPATVSPTAAKVAGGRRNPSAFGYEETAPQWLRVMAGWSWRILVVAVAVALVFWGTSRILLVFIAVFLGLVMTAVLRPLVNLLSRWVPRALATAISLVLAFLALAGMLAYIAFSVVGQYTTLAEQFNTGISTILDFLESSPLHLTITDQDLSEWFDQAQAWVTENSSQIASQALSSAGSVAIVFMVLALSTFCAVFFLSRGKEMWTWFLNQMPTRMRLPWHLGGDVAWYTFSGYARGTVIIAAVDGILAAIVLVALGVPLAAPLAVLVFIGAFIPLIGAPAAMIVAMIVALAANGFVNALLVGVAIALIGQFEGHILQPLVMGKQVSLHPVVVALGVTAGTLLAGILGAVIAIPLIAVAWAVFARLRRLDPPTDFAELESKTSPADETVPVE